MFIKKGLSKKGETCHNLDQSTYPELKVNTSTAISTYRTSYEEGFLISKTVLELSVMTVREYLAQIRSFEVSQLYNSDADNLTCLFL